MKKVLGFLAFDDGLDLCRLVCRRWNAVFKTLPIKPSVLDTKFPAAMEAFPDAQSLSVVIDDSECQEATVDPSRSLDTSFSLQKYRISDWDLMASGIQTLKNRTL